MLPLTHTFVTRTSPQVDGPDELRRMQPRGPVDVTGRDMQRIPEMPELDLPTIDTSARPRPTLDADRMRRLKQFQLASAILGGAFTLAADEEVPAVANVFLGASSGFQQRRGQLTEQHAEDVDQYQAWLDEATIENLRARRREVEASFEARLEERRAAIERDQELTDQEREERLDQLEYEREQEMARLEQELGVEREVQTEERLRSLGPSYDERTRRLREQRLREQGGRRDPDDLTPAQELEALQSDLQRLQEAEKAATNLDEIGRIRRDMRKVRGEIERTKMLVGSDTDTGGGGAGEASPAGVWDVTDEDLRRARRMLDAGQLTQEEYDALTQ
jgi:hypothetical protein